MPSVPVMMSTRSMTPELQACPPASPDEADCVRIIHEDKGAELVGEIADPLERRIRPVHREDAVGDDDLALGPRATAASSCARRSPRSAFL